jgi:glycosyltransferase involved in cell wall biosynthesis
MNNNFPFVSAIVPCRNEEKFIARCLDSVILQEYPKENLEILAVDGQSRDKTREIILGYARKYSYIKILDNPKKFTPMAMNLGIKAAKGEIVMKLDAHTIYDKNYILKCALGLDKYHADNVGGVLRSEASRNTLVARAIAVSLASKFGAGNSYVKIGVEEPKWVDAVAFGCFKKETLERVGLYDERMVRSQDFELNQRLRANGGKILLLPDAVGIYYPSSTLKSFFKHNFSDGLWVTYPLKFGKFVFSWRHLLPLFFVLSLIILSVLAYFSKFFLFIFICEVGLYIAVNLYSSAKLAWANKKFGFLFVLPIVFLARHLGYGLGSLTGFFKAIF